MTDCLLRASCNANELAECFFQEVPSNFGKGCDTATTLRLCGPWNTSATFPLRPRALKISDPCNCIWDLFPLTDKPLGSFFYHTGIPGKLFPLPHISIWKHVAVWGRTCLPHSVPSQWRQAVLLLKSLQVTTVALTENLLCASARVQDTSQANPSHPHSLNSPHSQKWNLRSSFLLRVLSYIPRLMSRGLLSRGHKQALSLVPRQGHSGSSPCGSS